MLNSWVLRAACLLSSVSLASRPQPSWAQSEPRVDDEDSLIREGVALRREGRDQDALALFERAYQRSRSPRSAAQLGLCEQALGRWVLAERHVREALAHESDPWIQRNRATLEGALRVAEQRLATVEIMGGVDGAELFVDGERVGALPADRSLRVVSGTARVEHRLRGDATISRVVTVEPGAIERVSFPTQRTSPQPTSQPSSPPQRSNDGPSNRPGPALSPTVHWSVWAASASIGAGLVTTIAGFAVGSSIDGAYRRDCVERDAEPTCVERMQREQATLDTLSIVTGVGWTLTGLGAVGAGVGIALSVAGRRERSLHVLPTASGLLLRSAF